MFSSQEPEESVSSQYAEQWCITAILIPVSGSGSWIGKRARGQSLSKSNWCGRERNSGYRGKRSNWATVQSYFLNPAYSCLNCWATFPPCPEVDLKRLQQWARYVILVTREIFHWYLTDLIFMKSRQLVKKITCHWTKSTVKSVFNAIYGAHPPLEYRPAPSGPSVQLPAPLIGPSCHEYGRYKYSRPGNMDATIVFESWITIQDWQMRG